MTASLVSEWTHLFGMQLAYLVSGVQSVSEMFENLGKSNAITIACHKNV